MGVGEVIDLAINSVCLCNPCSNGSSRRRGIDRGICDVVHIEQPISVPPPSINRGDSLGLSST